MGVLSKCLNALVLLLFRLVFADTICIFLTEWILYWELVATKKIRKPNPGSGEGGLKVIICGFSRSGTQTLQCAMDILGFPCFHGVNLFKPGQSRLFMKARKSGEREDWDYLLKDYTSISDFPATSCYKNLLELYPNAKVILNIRDPVRWYKSFGIFVNRKHMLPALAIVSCMNEVLYKEIFKGKEDDMEFATHIYNRHTEEVKAHVQPQSRLLVYEFGDNTKGWAPLCEFLGVEVPLVPFPHSNDSQHLKRGLSFIETIYNIVVATYFTLLAFLAFFILKLLV